MLSLVLYSYRCFGECDNSLQDHCSWAKFKTLTMEITLLRNVCNHLTIYGAKGFEMFTTTAKVKYVTGQCSCTVSNAHTLLREERESDKTQKIVMYFYKSGFSCLRYHQEFFFTVANKSVFSTNYGNNRPCLEHPTSRIRNKIFSVNSVKWMSHVSGIDRPNTVSSSDVGQCHRVGNESGAPPVNQCTKFM